MKYQVGDLLTTGMYFYLVGEVRIDKYFVIETQNQYKYWWKIADADNDRNLKKIN